jgi:hypothetical protein
MEHGWDKAVRDVYDFENVAALEEAWLQWMKTGESQLARPIPPRPSAKPASADPPLIPPVKLSGGQ